MRGVTLRDRLRKLHSLPLSFSSHRPPIACHTAISLPFTGRLGGPSCNPNRRRRAHSLLQLCHYRSTRFTGNRPHRAHIHILDDGSLLNIFYFCPLVLLDEDGGGDGRILGGGEWARERW